MESAWEVLLLPCLVTHQMWPRWFLISMHFPSVWTWQSGCKAWCLISLSFKSMLWKDRSTKAWLFSTKAIRPLHHWKISPFGNVWPVKWVSQVGIFFFSNRTLAIEKAVACLQGKASVQYTGRKQIINSIRIWYPYRLLKHDFLLYNHPHFYQRQ